MTEIKTVYSVYSVYSVCSFLAMNYQPFLRFALCYFCFQLVDCGLLRLFCDFGNWNLFGIWDLDFGI